MGKSITNLRSVTTVGLDLGKQVFQVHGVDASGWLWSPKRSGATSCWSFLHRCPPVLWGSRPADRRITGREPFRLGHEARMMPPAYVKPYIRRQKNDAADAAAICEAVTRPSMRFVAVRSWRTRGR